MSRSRSVPWAIWALVCTRLLGIAGVSWDVAWHRTIGRESFWLPPHLMVYSAVTAGALIVLVVFLEEQWTLPRGYGIMLCGWAVIVLSAPFDEWWHRRHGLDVDVWSPPHLMAVAGSLVSGLGLVATLMADTGRSAAKHLILVCFGLALWSPMFALGRFTIVAWTRDAVLYPALASLLVPFVLVAAIQAMPLRWAATVTASVYLALMLVMAWILGSAGLKPTSPPPLLLVPALALDGIALSLGRGRFWFGPLTGIVFALTFFGTEYVWTWMVVGHAWLTDRLLPGIAWSVPAGAFSGLLGDHLGRLLARAASQRSQTDQKGPDARRRFERRLRRRNLWGEVRKGAVEAPSE